MFGQRQIRNKLTVAIIFAFFLHKRPRSRTIPSGINRFVKTIRLAYASQRQTDAYMVQYKYNWTIIIRLNYTRTLMRKLRQGQNLTRDSNADFHNGESNGKVMRNPYPWPHHHQKLIASGGSPSWPCLPCLVDVRGRDHEWSCLQYDRMTERAMTLLRHAASVE